MRYVRPGAEDVAEVTAPPALRRISKKERVTFRSGSEAASPHAY